jgi:hypothetical protein
LDPSPAARALRVAADTRTAAPPELGGAHVHRTAVRRRAAAQRAAACVSFFSKREFEPNRPGTAARTAQSGVFSWSRIAVMPMHDYYCENFHDSRVSAVSVPGIA